MTTGHPEGMMISQLHQQIAQAVVSGRTIDEIELSIIEPAPLAEDEKSALWLYAQALAERPHRERARERNPAPLSGR
jgi:hypothetical protein